MTRTYDRGFQDGHFLIDNPDRVDGEGNQIHLASEVQAALPGWEFLVRCSGMVCSITSETSLSPEQLATLDATVEAHKLNL